jgi:dTDP-4-dehydrorhamnose reductase
MPTAKRVLVLGASGIVGQHLRLFEPQDYDVCYQSRQRLPWADVHQGTPTWQVDFTKDADVAAMLAMLKPDIVINLAGENRPDVVEQDPVQYDFINVQVPVLLAHWADTAPGRWLIHVSSQAVFGGLNAPYHARPPLDTDNDPVNAYGWQKLYAEQHVLDGEKTLVVRLTFVLGVRPFPHCGRPNPLETMFTSPAARQVNDRWFSVCWAQDAARGLWELLGTLDPLDPLLDRYLQRRRVLHLGSSVEYTRYELAVHAAMQVDTMDHARGTPTRVQWKVLSELVEPVKHDDAFPAPRYARRPVDTTFAPGGITYTGFDEGLHQSAFIWRHTVDLWSLNDRAKELAVYFNVNEGQAQTELLRGFHHHHAEVAKDFRDAQHKARADASRGLAPSSGWDAMRLLQWYKATERYCWELTAYHLDVPFNYKGMCEGIRDYCLQHNWQRVLVLGDGVGDCTMVLHDAGLAAVYHDLLASVTARFALFRMTRRYGGSAARPGVFLSENWLPPSVDQDPALARSLDAVVALDFFEHLPNVPDWAAFVAAALKPGGEFLAQNAFGIGDDAHEGSIPMHLVENIRYVEEWPALLASLGLTCLPSGWWRMAA